jgi:GABA permease
LASPEPGTAPGTQPGAASGTASGGEHVRTRQATKLRNRHVTMIALGGIIGSSLFIGSGNIIRDVGPAAILSYLLGGLLVFLAMKMLGEMAASRPAVGSFMDYARDGLGDGASYLVGWLYWYFWVGVLAYESVIGGETMHGWFSAVPSWAWSLILLAVFVGSNAVSVRNFGEIEFWLAGIKVIAVIVFLVAGVLFAFGVWPGSDFTVDNLWNHGGFAPNGLSQALTGVAIVIFAYFGTEIAVMAAAESEDPGKGVRRATNTVIWRILLFFVGSVAVIAAIVPWDELPDPTDVSSAPFTYVFERIGLPGASTVMQLVIFTAVLSVLNSGLYSASRMLSAMGDQGFAPKPVRYRNRRGVPMVALLASTVGGVAATIVNFAFPDTGIFDFIMNSSGLVALFVYVIIAATHWNMRRKMTAAEVSALEMKAPLYPWLNILLIAGVIAVFIVMVVQESSRTQVWTSLIATGVVVVLWPLVKRNLRRRSEQTDGGTPAGA